MSHCAPWNLRAASSFIRPWMTSKLTARPLATHSRANLRRTRRFLDIVVLATKNDWPPARPISPKKPLAAGPFFGLWGMARKIFVSPRVFFLSCLTRYLIGDEKEKRCVSATPARENYAPDSRFGLLGHVEEQLCGIRAGTQRPVLLPTGAVVREVFRLLAFACASRS